MMRYSSEPEGEMTVVLGDRPHRHGVSVDASSDSTTFVTWRENDDGSLVVTDTGTLGPAPVPVPQPEPAPAPDPQPVPLPDPPITTITDPEEF